MVFRSEIPKNEQILNRRRIIHYEKTARVLSCRFTLLQRIVIGFRWRTFRSHSYRQNDRRIPNYAVFEPRTIVVRHINGNAMRWYGFSRLTDSGHRR